MLFRWRRRQRTTETSLPEIPLHELKWVVIFCLFLFVPVRVFVGSRLFHVLRVVSVKKPDFFNKRIIKRRDDLRISCGCNYFHQTMHEILVRVFTWRTLDVATFADARLITFLHRQSRAKNQISLPLIIAPIY